MSEKFRNKYSIEPNRWQFWDYSAPGNYFITICIEDRDEILGKIVNGKMHLSSYGEIVKNEFLRMRYYHEHAVLKEWVIMPNHIHFIITLGNRNITDGTVPVTAIPVEKIHEFSLPPILPILSPIHSIPTLSEEVDIKQYRRLRRKMLIPLLTGKFQMLTSKKINILRNTPGKQNWQPSYHDHVIRDDQEYFRIRQYIINNPAKWEDDTFNSRNGGVCNDDGFQW